jgi:hypothetical protein
MCNKILRGNSGVGYSKRYPFSMVNSRVKAIGGIFQSDPREGCGRISIDKEGRGLIGIILLS